MSKKRIVLIFLIIAIILLLFRSCYCPYNYAKQISLKDDKFTSFSNADFGNYSELFCQESKTGNMIFQSRCSTIIATYDDVQYTSQCNQLKKLDYQTTLYQDEFGHYLTPPNEFDIGKWHFKVLDQDPDSYYTYRIIGCNDSLKNIAYLTFNDEELDFFCQEDEINDDDYIQKFMKKHFKYDFL